MKKQTILNISKLICVIVAVCSIIKTYHLYWKQDPKLIRYQDRYARKSSEKIIIFAATKFFDSPIDNSYFDTCSKEIQNTCSFTSEDHLFNLSHAVLFHSKDINETGIKNFPFKRRSEIPYIMWALENPYFAELNEYKDFFNWTMSYKKDSDVFMPYGALIKNTVTVPINYTEIWETKKKEVLWLVSNNIHVKNRRKEVVDKMKELGMKVDLFGSVYHNEPSDCKRFKSDKSCEVKFHSPYKFTIAFENTNCKDYVTEKFWKKAGQYKTVPIVMERKVYRDLGIPDSLYIAIDDFPSLKEFVDYLNKVSANETEYMKFHKWREEYRMSLLDDGYCQLCQKLIDFRGGSKSYKNLKSWHNTSDCDNSFSKRYL